MAAVRATRGRLASWFVLGSNDYFAPQPAELPGVLPQEAETAPRRDGDAPAELVAQLSADGWNDLTNVRRDVDLDGLAVELLGLDDAHIAWHDLPGGAPARARPVRLRGDALAGLRARRRPRWATT